MKIRYFAILIAAALLFLISCQDSNTSPADITLAAPEFSPPGGNYDEEIAIHIHCPSYGAAIRFTTDGSDPSPESEEYTGLIHINSDTILKARAFKSGYLPSTMVSAYYEFSSSAVQPVIISPNGGTFHNPQKVSLSCPTPAAQIYYTLDGSDPDQDSNLYTQAIQICSSATLKAKAYAEDMIPGIISSAEFHMSLQEPIFSLEEGQYATSQIVSIIEPYPEAQIHYTTDGSEPDESSSLYWGPIVISTNTMLKAKAYLEGWEPSNVASALYIINLADQMQLVQGGSFHNGTSTVTLSPFFIGRREVTELEWVYIMQDMTEIDPDKPKCEINWAKAIEYCNYRSIAEEYEPCYSYAGSGTIPEFWPAGWQADTSLLQCNWNADGYRLPTEMEWMYAAKGGHLSQDYIYSGSNTIDDVAWYSGNSSAPEYVGTKLPNELGIFDMSGNVWEFCWDFYHNDYPAGESTDYHGPDAGFMRVMRGGSFSTDATNCTNARRFYASPNLVADSHGLRVVRRQF